MYLIFWAEKLSKISLRFVLFCIEANHDNDREVQKNEL